MAPDRLGLAASERMSRSPDTASAVNSELQHEGERQQKRRQQYLQPQSDTGVGPGLSVNLQGTRRSDAVGRCPEREAPHA